MTHSGPFMLEELPKTSGVLVIGFVWIDTREGFKDYGVKSRDVVHFVGLIFAPDRHYRSSAGADRIWPRAPDDDQGGSAAPPADITSRDTFRTLLTGEYVH